MNLPLSSAAIALASFFVALAVTVFIQRRWFRTYIPMDPMLLSRAQWRTNKPMWEDRARHLKYVQLVIIFGMLMLAGVSYGIFVEEYYYLLRLW